MSSPENFEKLISRKVNPIHQKKVLLVKKTVKEIKFSIKTSFVIVFSFLLSMKLAMQSAVRYVICSLLTYMHIVLW